LFLGRKIRKLLNIEIKDAYDEALDPKQEKTFGAKVVDKVG